MSDRNQSQVQAVESPPAPQPWAVDAYADKLMDEVFEDIDRGLDLAETPLDTPVNAPDEPVSLQPIQIPPIVMQPIVSTPDATATVDAAKPKRDRALMWFDRFSIALFATSALAALLLWQIQRGNLPPWMQADSPDADAAAAETEAAELDPELIRDREFSSYITQSLDRIEGRIPSNEDNSVIGDTLPQVAGQTATLSIPVDPASSETMLRSLNRIAGALERVSSRPLPLPSAPTASAPDSDDSSPSSSERANPTPSNRGSLPSIRVPAPVVVAPPPAPPARSSSGSSGSAPADADKQPAASATTYSLVGTLDRGGGARPAALFEVNGSASWVNVGETVGDSNWVVVEVVDDSATIERNGTTRSLSVGQEF